jgi:large subunit ribosomal protein L23
MKLEPVITEKSANLAEEGKYTFKVSRNATKHTIKKMVEEMFGVKVRNVNVINKRSKTKRTLMGRKRVVPASKKAIVSLGEKDKIDLFESSKK